MLQHFRDADALIDVAVQHPSDQIDARLAHDVRHAQVVVHDLVDAVERVFLVDDCVKQDAQCPHVLFFSAVGFAGEDFGGGVVCVLWGVNNGEFRW
jgi:hypothetical protein